MMKVGVSTHIHVYREMSPDLLKDIARAGFESVELYCNHPHWPMFDVKADRDQIIGACNDLGLSINSIHTPFFRKLEDAKQGRWYSISTKDTNVCRESIGRIVDSLAVAENATIEAAVVHVGSPTENEDGGTWDRLYYALDEDILPVAREVGITIALENITNDFSRGHRIAEFIRESGLTDLGCCYDCGHATLFDRTVDELNEMAPHLATTHIHDTTDGLDNHLLPYAGEIDWETLAATFAGIKYTGDFIIETKDPDSTFEMLEKAAEAGKRFRAAIKTQKPAQN